MANATLERIVSIDANRRKLGKDHQQVSILLCLASMDKPLRYDLFKKMGVETRVIVKHFESLLKHGYITEDGEGKHSNNQTYPRRS